MHCHSSITLDIMCAARITQLSNEHELISGSFALKFSLHTRLASLLSKHCISFTSSMWPLEVPLLTKI